MTDELIGKLVNEMKQFPKNSIDYIARDMMVSELKEKEICDYCIKPISLCDCSSCEDGKIK